MKILIMAGGTGGHVFPALAVAQSLRGAGHEVVWMGTREGLEARIAPEHGFDVEWIRVHGLRGTGLRRWLTAPLVLARALIQALAALRRQRPAVVLGMGGFAAGPGGVAAWLLRRPLVIHEQNAAAGMTNRWLARFARLRLQAFPGALAGAETVGNPVREGFACLPPPEARAALRDGPIHLLVLGGSLGARALNERLPAALARLPAARRPLVRHQGGRSVEVAEAAYAAAGVEAHIEAFIDDMPSAYGWADLVVCRAGAMTIAELAAAGVAAVLVPFPYAADDHQARNADYLVRAGAAECVAESALSVDRLAERIDALSERGRLVAMGVAARAVAAPDAVRRIAQHCLEVARP